MNKVLMPQQPQRIEPNAQIIRRAQMSISNWAGGSTLQLAIYPAQSSVAAQDFLWRFSSATVEQSGAFTQFAAHQRLLALRQGAGFTLQVDNHQAQVDNPYHCLRFAGKSHSSAQLNNGAVTDINLMLAAGYQGNMQAVPLGSDWQPFMMPRPEHSTLLLWSDELALEVRQGSAAHSDAQSWLLQPGDLLLLEHWPLAQRPEFRSPTNQTGSSLVLAWIKML
ncbi:HutD family protein [Rheinheimera sp. 4Y26]|uniref:HutD/Ves family protein n=1 Tax=Rheinheimera sp. 4Y26 TaxID=2977811 RepID=UPI0021B0A696|nr:HutD family protein [Rheinheimera sp. 4Y26]MCT6700024.1 HutD family protein [Rheinheimera sp. 4Y26]